MGNSIGKILDYVFVPRICYRPRLSSIMAGLSYDEREIVMDRVAYYNKLQEHTHIDGATTVGQYKFPFKKKQFGDKKSRLSTYFFDQYSVLKYFPAACRFRYEHGDVTHVPSQPAFVKSRPIVGDNVNAILLKLDQHRHFRFVHDEKAFAEKKNMLVSRTTWCNARPHRRRFCEMFWDHPMCNIGKSQAEPNEDFPESIKGFLSIEEQLDYKFVACIEGMDVATNLKWVMSSNSVAVSTPMIYETWYMEGRLIPDYHYIEVKPDYSDLIEKIEYYIAHPSEAETIIEHAHEWVKQFQNPRIELATQLAVAQKYFDLTDL